MYRFGLLVCGGFASGLGIVIWQSMQPAGSMIHPRPTALSDLGQGVPTEGLTGANVQNTARYIRGVQRENGVS